MCSLQLKKDFSWRHFFAECRFNTGDYICSLELLFAHKNYPYIFSKIIMVCAYNIHKSSELNKRQDNANSHSLFSLNNHDEAVTYMPIFLVLFFASGKIQGGLKSYFLQILLLNSIIFQILMFFTDKM